MRISDWSSDVCSSDLLQEGSWQGTIRRRNPRGENVEASVRRFVRFQDDGSVRDIAEVGRGSLGLSAAGRSEEHTSELQSLMRISYAVFCLKKKKHTPTRYTHNHTTSHQ